jgi:hypothetical protein
MSDGKYSGPLGWRLLELQNLDGSPYCFHVVPVDDLREHPLDSQCWCKPTVSELPPVSWTHNSADRREEFELGRKTS